MNRLQWLALQSVRPGLGRWPGLILAGLAVSFGGVISVVALGSAIGFIALPYTLALIDQALPAVFRVHMAASAFALLLLPVVIACRHRTTIHRNLGRGVACCVIIGGMTALPVALVSTSSPASRWGFAVQGCVWLMCLVVGLKAIRRRDRTGHIRAMLAMTAVTTGAVWFRLATGLAALAALPMEPTYAITAWLAWLVPLVIVLSWPGPVIGPRAG
jgi:uncharacterized membrane protein YozB (DUF420 family)